MLKRGDHPEIRKKVKLNMRPKVIVIGSANTDFVVQVDELPTPGETVLGGKFLTAHGGKGANQAVAAARLGAEVFFVARLGQDSLGREAADAYRREGIHTEALVWDREAPSGVALILVNKQGENMIAVAPGANGHLLPEDIRAAEEAIRTADCVLLQLEIPMETVFAAVELAQRHSKRVILNPAPAAPLSADLLKLVDVLTPNETEAKAIAGAGAEDEPETIAALLSKKTGIGTIVMTMGSKGAFILEDQQPSWIPAFPITAIDTTAAGDAFNGALAVALARGDSIVDAARFGSAAGALSVSRPGAQPSLPTGDEVRIFMSKF
jgi:ribokinase